MQLVHTLKLVDDSLTFGEVYYFRTRTHNSVGYSAYSNMYSCNIALVNLPSVITTLSVDYSVSD